MKRIRNKSEVTRDREVDVKCGRVYGNIWRGEGVNGARGISEGKRSVEASGLKPLRLHGPRPGRLRQSRAPDLRARAKTLPGSGQRAHNFRVE